MGLLPVLAACNGKTASDSGAALTDLSLAGLEPSAGPEGGGTEITITGAGFTSSTTASVAGDDCAATAVVSETEITCTSPPGDVGEALLVVLRADDGATASTTWTYVAGSTTTSGTSGGSGGTTSGGTSGGTGGTTATEAVDYCHLQWPCTMEAEAGQTTEGMYVWVYHEGVTPGPGGGKDLQVHVGIGPDGSSADSADWSWTTAAFNAEQDGLHKGDQANDEYAGFPTAPATAGSYDYAGRVSADGGASWTLCDLGGDTCGGDGSNDGYDAATSGSLTVP